MPYDLITILGPTATGKTSIASGLARDFNCEIISADSRQVYKWMDIGTGKDLIEFQKNNIKYHLIDIVTPFEEYNLFRFTKDFQTAFSQIKKNERTPILVGGTGLYLSAVLQSYSLPEIINEANNDLSSFNLTQLKEILIDLKPKLHNITDITTKDRLIQAILIERSRDKNTTNPLHFSSLNIGIKTDREELQRRISERLKNRLVNGMIEEVKDLIAKGVSREKLFYFGLEYKFISKFIDGELNYNDMFQKLNSAIQNFAKRQMTWFRKMEREGVVINWFTPNDYPAIKDFVKIQLNLE
jgi:tRNA dimethylallyltransferase